VAEFGSREVAQRPPAVTDPAALASPTRPAPSTQLAGESEKRCGDGVCDGPENAGNCPEDCAAPTSEVARASVPPVYVTAAGYIEDVPIYTNCDAYPNYREKLLRFAEAIVEYDVPLNLQIEYEFF
jgi:hypothetical protein